MQAATDDFGAALHSADAAHSQSTKPNASPKRAGHAALHRSIGDKDTAPASQPTSRNTPDLRADGDVGPAGFLPRPLKLAEPVWSKAPAQPTATIPFYIRGEHTPHGYIRGSYLREGDYIQGEWTSNGYLRGNYRGAGDNYIRGEWTPNGYVRGNYRSEPLFAAPNTLTTLPPSGSQVPAYHYP